MDQSAGLPAFATTAAHTVTVRQFRQIVLWPLQLMPLRADVQIHRHWDLLSPPGPDNPWHEVLDEFTDVPGELQERPIRRIGPRTGILDAKHAVKLRIDGERAQLAVEELHTVRHRAQDDVECAALAL